ncbi:MAG: transposase, partial [Lachnospiraceae bacterium]|nr:transposase [Lachnospiraceae bacterium]
EVFGFLQRAEDKDRLREYLEANEEKFENLSMDAYDMISVMGHSKELHEIRDKYHEEKGGRSNMCQAIKDMIEDGRQEGVQEERQRNVVSSVESVMQNLGLALEAACKALSITEEDYNRAKRAVQ